MNCLLVDAWLAAMLSIASAAVFAGAKVADHAHPIPSHPALTAAAPSLAWLNASRSPVHQAATEQQLATAESLWLSLWQSGRLSDEQRSAWAALGYEVQEVDGTFGFRELPDQHAGRGSYLLRPAGGELLLQIPHRYHDKHSGPIGYQWWLGDARVSAAAFNTVPRQQFDVAKSTSSMLLAFTKAFVAAHPEHGRVVQLHGFASDKRRSRAGRRSELILSAGHRRPSNQHRRAVRCLNQAAVVSRLFPKQVSELGGTRNGVAEVLRNGGFKQFFHVELNAALRTRLLNNPAVLAELIQCF